MNLTLIRGDALVASPWKNGGGITREIASREHAWRVSMADIDRDGPFSRFDGIDRLLMVLDGVGVTLGGPRLLQAFDVERFPGETPVAAHLASGPVRVLNVMTHRGVARASVDILRTPGRQRLAADTALLLCAQGSLEVRAGATRIALTRFDTLRIDRADAVEIDIQGDGVAVCTSLDTEVDS
ncbi:HutD family protein [Caballeronia sp. LZ062]|uniref:HutD/Ves family protein n=1 Tax=unclassified Caballeronia TaxID=2646786 RepID=UPI0028566A28|nr:MULTISPECIES: HutD family protein [unclassified Caballeronia]MDR5856158.1 HutD family protein [Caballeronia sp. LZ050]MDR5872829.1 HutD family protein [Caballeronia sp. LZ062]